MTRQNVLFGMAGLLLAAFAASTTGCNYLRTPGPEVSRVASPDGQVELVVEHHKGGFLSSDVYELYIVLPGRSTRGAKRMLWATYVDILSTRWVANRVAEVTYHAVIHEFDNYWATDEIGPFGDSVEVILQRAAPQGLAMPDIFPADALFQAPE